MNYYWYALIIKGIIKMLKSGSDKDIYDPEEKIRPKVNEKEQ